MFLVGSGGGSSKPGEDIVQKKSLFPLSVGPSLGRAVHVHVNAHPFLHHHPHYHHIVFIFVHAIHLSSSPLLTQSYGWRCCDDFLVFTVENYIYSVTSCTCDSMYSKYRLECFCFNPSVISGSMSLYNIRVSIASLMISFILFKPEIAFFFPLKWFDMS